MNRFCQEIRGRAGRLFGNLKISIHAKHRVKGGREETFSYTISHGLMFPNCQMDEQILGKGIQFCVFSSRNTYAFQINVTRSKCQHLINATDKWKIMQPIKEAILISFVDESVADKKF